MNISIKYILHTILFFGFSKMCYSFPATEDDYRRRVGSDQFIEMVNKRTSAILSESKNYDDLTIQLKNYYIEILNSNRSVYGSSLKTPQEKFAGIIVELALWDNIWVQIGQLISKQVIDEIASLHRPPIETLMMESRIRYETSSQISELIGVPIKKQIEEQVEDFINAQLWIPVGALVKGLSRDEWKRELSLFELITTSSSVSANNQAIIPAVTYLGTVYQLLSLDVRNSVEFENIMGNACSFISENLTSVQVEDILENLIIPTSQENNYLVDAHLEFIKRHILIES